MPRRLLQSQLFGGDRLFTLGNARNVVLVERSTSLAANTALTNVLIGTPVTPSITADSLILSDITASGDMLVAVNNGGNSQAVLKVVGATGSLVIYNAGVAQLTTGVGGFTLNVATAVTLATSVTALNISSGLLDLDTTNTRVGIGNTAPVSRLDVQGGGIVLTGNHNYIAREVQDDTTRRGVLLGYDSTGQIGTITAASAGAASILAFWTYSGGAWVERMRMDGAGVITLADAVNIAVNATTGTIIGTATTQKLGFYNATPIVRRSGAAQAAVATTASTNTSPYGYTTAAQADAIVTLVNELRAWAVAQGLIAGA